MRNAAATAGLADITVTEEPVDVGVNQPEALVDYRFGQANFAQWITTLTPDTRVAVRDAATGAIGATMEPYRPRVIFLTARSAPRR